MIFGYGKHTARRCRYIFSRFLDESANHKNLYLTNKIVGPACFWIFYALQSHPAFTEYQDLLEDLEEKLASVANEEEKWKQT